jgi:hypothetical protein
VVEELVEAVAVGQQRSDGVERRAQVDLARLRPRARHVDRGLDEPGERQRPRLQLESPGLQLRHEQDVADEPRQALGVAVDDGDERPRLIVELDLVAQQLEEPVIAVSGVRSSYGG